MTSTAVLFVCVGNAGKSVMAAGLLRHIAGPGIRVASAGTDAKSSLNELSVQALAEIGVDISGHRPIQLTEAMIDDADLVVVVGSQAAVADRPGTAIERWDTDEPSQRGIDGIERMRLIRDDITIKVRQLVARASTSYLR